MKSFIAILAFFVSTSAFADTQIVYTGTTTSEVKETVNFPGHGSVPANRVCVSADHETLSAYIVGHEVKKCVASYVDHSDTTYPKTVCTKYETVQVPSQKWTRALTITTTGCTKWAVDHTDSTRPVSKCVEYGSVEQTQALTYELRTYNAWDYRHENPQYSRVAIPTCK